MGPISVDYVKKPISDNNLDAVYTYVNNDDPKWIKKFNKYRGSRPFSGLRYSDNGELKFSIKTLKKFCPYVRKIFIVTDDQDVPWARNDPQIIIVDHDEILGKECIRPTFKSNSIESYLHNIPGLSECFLYLNDDTFIGRPLNRNLIIEHRMPMVYLRNPAFFNMLDKPGYPINTNSRAVLNSMRCIENMFNQRTTLVPIHQMEVMRKSCCKLAWKIFKSDLEKSVSNRFRFPIENTLRFVILSQYLGLLMGYLKLGNLSNLKLSHTKMLDLLSLSNEKKMTELLKCHLNNILEKRPHLFCINFLTKKHKLIFEDFQRKYLGYD